VIVHQTWESEDMAESDTWHPTLAAAIACVRERYGVEGPIKLDGDGQWEGPCDSGFQCYIERHKIQPTRQSVCNALQFLPNR